MDVAEGLSDEISFLITNDWLFILFGRIIIFDYFSHNQVLNLNRCNLPVAVLGSSLTNSIIRGYLYGAKCTFT